MKHRVDKMSTEILDVDAVIVREGALTKADTAPQRERTRVTSALWESHCPLEEEVCL